MTKQLEDFKSFLIQNSYSLNTQKIILGTVSKYLESKSTPQEYRNLLIKEYSPSTINMRIYSLNKWFEFQQTSIKLKGVPFSKNKHLENVIGLEEYKELIYYIKTKGFIEEYFMLRTLGCTGMRPSELLKLSVKDVINGKARICSKRNKTRIIFFTESLKRDLIDWTTSMNRKENLFKLSVDHLRYIMRMGVDIGIPRKVLHPYSLRHMFGKAFISRNSNITMLSDIMGHESIETTRIYTRMTLEEQKQSLINTVDWDF